MSFGRLFLRSSFGFGPGASKRAVRRYAAELCNDVSKPVNFKTILAPRRIGGTSNCKFDESGHVDGFQARANVLFIDLARTSDELDDAFIRVLVATGHEVRHLRQIEPKDPELALIYLAECGNDHNYTSNYAFNRREIDAELSGLKLAQAYLKKQFPHIDGDALLLRYVNGRISDGYTYWISGPDGGFESLDDAFQAFDDAYDAAATHVNRYVYKPTKTCQDAFVRLTGVGSGNGINPDWEFMYDALRDAHDAYESNLILASAALYHDPGLIKYANGAPLPDLSIQAVFGREPPVSKPEPDPEKSQDSQNSGSKSYSYSPKMQELIMKAERDRAKHGDPEVNPGPEK